MQTADTPLLIAERPAANGCVLGVLTLNVESSLNSLTLEMIRAMTKALGNWRSRDDLVAVVLNGRGPKAFCAGGDVKSVAIDGKQGTSLPADQFRAEYELIDAVARFNERKSMVSILDGIAMGCGAGLVSRQACSSTTCGAHAFEI